MVIKQYLPLLALILLSTAIKAQHNEHDKIYCTAIETYITAMDSLQLKYPAISKKTTEIYLEKPYFVDSIPSIINGHPIIIITDRNKESLYKAHKNKLIHTVMLPLTNARNQLYITITPYNGVLKKRKHFNLGVSEGTTVYFKLNENKQEYIVEKIKHWGI